MTKLEEVGTLIENLNFEEKAQLLTELLLQMNVSALGIRHTAGVCGGRACIRDTRRLIYP